MGVNASKIKAMYDDALVLRDVADGAETSTATETPLNLNEVYGPYWADGTEIPNGVMQVTVNVTACDDTSGDETYVLTLQVDDTSDHSNSPVTVATATITRGFTGSFDLFVDSKMLPKFNTDNSGAVCYMAVKATLAGTTPSITYGAWISKSHRA